MSGATESPLRIAILGNPNSIHVRRWAAFFAERGHEMHVIAPEGDVEAMTVAQDLRWQVHTFAALRQCRIPGPGVPDMYRSLRRVLAEIEPDVLHSQAVSRYGFAAWLSRFRPYAITVWGSDVLIVPTLSRRRSLYTRLALRAAALVTGGSEHLVKAAIRAGARPERTVYLHMGVDTEHFSPGDGEAMRARLGLPKKARIVLSPRAIRPLYRQDVVVEAFARLPADTLLLMTRHLAAADEKAALTARAQSLGVADRLRIVPEVAEADVPELYRLADVVVSVPVSDGGPNTVVEALACGRPIVASDLPPNREWLSDLDPGSLVPVGDVEATARALSTILGRRPAQGRELAERGRAAVCERADRRVTMARMEALYRDLASRRKGNR